MRQLLTLLGIMLLCAQGSSAQTRSVSGRITDLTGFPVQNASIIIRGTHSGTTSDADGNFTIPIKRGDVLVISAIGFNPAEMKVGTQSSLQVQLSAGNRTMDEVIVTAGGIKSKKREIGTANTVIKSEVLTTGKAVSIAGGL